MVRRPREYSPVLIRHAKSQGGVALAMVVWFVAAMSLLVVGIVSEARVDVRMAQTHIARAKTMAAGDGAINLLLSQQALLREAQATSAEGELEPVIQAGFMLGEQPVLVRMTPVSRLLDLRTTGVEQLAQLFAAEGGLASEDAQRLAGSVIQLRDGHGGRLRFSSGLRTVEDWLQLPGFDRALLDGIRDRVRMDDSAGYRLDAIVDYDGRRWVRRRWVILQGGAATSGFPWRVTRTEAPRVLNETKTAGAR
jgi:general secretion pathway protein K